MNEEKFYTPEELETQLASTKRFLDKTYLDVKLSRYGQEQANIAMTDFLANGDYGSFPGEHIREQFEELSYHGDEIYQILLDFAISSYITDKQKGAPAIITTLDQVHAYTDTNDETLQYDSKTIIEIAALATAENTYWTTNLLACNKKLKTALVKAFVEERYNTPGRKKELDSVPKSKLIKLASGKMLTMSKAQLNRDINNMMNDEFYNVGYFNPDNLVNIQINNKNH